MKFTHFSLYTTEACSLACKYPCFLPKNPRDAKPKTLKAIIDWCFKVAGPKVHIHVFGTEPLYRWDLLKTVVTHTEKVSAACRKPTTKGITTNCLGLTRRRAEWLTKHKVSALCSIDGMKSNHDKFRVLPNGKGSWSIVTKHAKYWVELNPNAEAAMVVTPNCIKQLAQNINAIYKLGFNAVAMNKIEDTGKMYTPAELDLFEQRLDDVIELIVHHALSGRRVNAMFLTNALVHRLKKTDKVNPAHTCGAAKGSVAFDIHGNIYICHRGIYDDIFKLGNVFKGINWKRVDWWRKQRNKVCNYCTMPNCSSCFTDSFHRHGDPLIVSWQSCRYNQIVYKKSFDLERRLRQTGVLGRLW